MSPHDDLRAQLFVVAVIFAQAITISSALEGAVAGS